MSWMWRHNPRRFCTLYSLVAFQLTIKGLPVTTAPLATSCRNSPHRQLKFAIRHNRSLIAILRIHASAFNAHRPSVRGLSSMSVMGSTYSTNTFTLSSKPDFCARSGTIKELGATTRRCLSQMEPGRALGRREGYAGVLGCRAGLRGLLRRAIAAKRAGAGVR
jgi:hypothetical protein